MIVNICTNIHHLILILFFYYFYREVQHKNVVRFVGACTQSPHLCIVTGKESSDGYHLWLHASFLHESFILSGNHMPLYMFSLLICATKSRFYRQEVTHCDSKGGDQYLVFQFQ